jgi:MSHA biogenesis protein MshQ
VSSLRTPPTLTVEGVAVIVSGRARLTNAYGSELLDLPVGMRTESWNGTGWVLNTLDTCTGDTTLGAANAVSVALTSSPAGLPTCIRDTGNPGLSGAGCVAAATTIRRFKEGATPSVGFAGDFNLWLQAPGANSFGSTLLTATVPAWLGTVPAAIATFGRYKTPLIYRRENY